ncbi:MAG: phosphoribosylamine--glycine ligase [Candidatus Pacebacteria bacterium]|nr:phosphoribosylamine--glycine ligase [Candidatus Paceibacterota bacterium]MCF7863056.1 phosphoribosylamine--glycine ligase [Candidatus Paceibacterota bacterium]
MTRKQKILIIGSGGREHAVGWKIAQSPFVDKMYFAPGNAGTSMLGENIDIKAIDIEALKIFAQENNIDITLALPDDPLALGIVNEFEKVGLKIFGPTKESARLESSKAFAKNFMQKYNLPTASFQIFEDEKEAKKYLNTHTLPVVVKASGLALGKGVFICQTKEEAEKRIDEIMVDKLFGEAGKQIVIEEFLTGPEISIHLFSDGNNYAIFPPSQDHKRIGEGDTGLNTGGMGTISPLPFVSQDLLKEIEESVVKPALLGMQKEGFPFKGILYPGLILTKNGPKILEFNARFGDPETQSYMRLLDSDLLEIVNACIDGNINNISVNWKKDFACTIVLASSGYPGNYQKGSIIKGIQEAEKEKDIVVFQAGTKLNNEGDFITNGGRVLGVSAIGSDLKESLKKAYNAIENNISFEGMQYRKDIGFKSLNIKYI